MRRLASLNEINSPAFRSFLSWVNSFAQTHGLRVHTNWSKIWEYPWVWQCLSGLHFPGMRILDIGSEISPMPWFFSALGADVVMVETNDSYVPKWQEIRGTQGFSIDWALTNGHRLPFPDSSFDLVTSFSVIEHIPEKQEAIAEAVRVLKPGGCFCLTFDICEKDRGMTFPEWNGSALDMASFERLLWKCPDLEPIEPNAHWNTEAIDPFLEWHRQTAPHHNYVVGGAVFRKRRIPSVEEWGSRARGLRVHLLDTGLGSGNIGDDAMFLGALSLMPPDACSISVEVHSLERAVSLPNGVRYIHVKDQASVERSLREADVVFLSGDTPVMDEWGITWPLQSNVPKLELCRALGKAVHAAGVGVDRLRNPEAFRIFREVYLSIASWSVRSAACKRALIEMGVAAENILIGADWAWLFRPTIDAGWAKNWLRQCGAEPGRKRIGVNLVNEIWRDRSDLKRAWAAALDRLSKSHDAQVFFFCNESREGDYFDSAAALQVAELMKNKAVLVPRLYYEPSQMVSLLAQMHVNLSLRYHFTLFSVQAGVYPVSVRRGQKMKTLSEELHLPDVGDMEHFDAQAIEAEVASALEDPSTLMKPLKVCRSLLEMRAANNLVLAKLPLVRGLRNE